MSTGDGYALDLLSPVRHVATEMERAGLDGPAPTVEAMTATYEHVIRGDLTRICEHEGLMGDYEARLWLIGRAVRELGKQVTVDGDGGCRLAKPFDELRFKGRKLHRAASEDDEDEKRALRAVYNDLALERSFYVAVAGARGGTKNAQLTLHPLARAIPPMTEDEFANFAQDAKANGIYDAITVMDGKVIDGRHRVAVAAALKLPVRAEEFTGTEDEARSRIISKNLMRRHLTIAQRALVVLEVFLPEAEAEARERMLAGNTGENADATLPPVGGRVEPKPKRGSTAVEIAAARSMGMASARTLERMKPVLDAPQTRERIRRGEIKTGPSARAAALEETKKTAAPKDIEALAPKTAYSELGQALNHLRTACERIEKDDLGAERGQGIPAAKFSQRVTDLRDAVDCVEKLLQEKQVIQP